MNRPLLNKRLLAPLLGGGLYALTFAPGPLLSWALPWIQLALLALLVHGVLQAPTVGQAAVTGWLFGFANFAVGLYWLTISMHVYGQMPLALAVGALLLFAAYLALFGALACAITRRLCQPADAGTPPARLLWGATIWAAAWSGGEWLRGSLFTGFPWLSTAYGQVEGWLAGWAVLGGAHGTTFVTAWIAAAIALTLAAQARQPASSFTPMRGLTLAAAILLAFAGATLAQTRFTEPIGTSITTRLIQGNIEQGTKFEQAKFADSVRHHLDLAAHQTQNQPAKAAQPTLILLPETVMTRFPQQVPVELWQAWADLAKAKNATILLGAPLYDAVTRNATNSVIAIDPQTQWQHLATSRPPRRYDKQHLVPFGEFVPVGFRWFVDLMRIPLGDFTRGSDQQAAFAVGSQQVAANICYEDVFGEELLPAVRRGATILANFSNLGWFGDSWALGQHWQMARLRAIETQRPMLRSTNTGITGAIAETGQPIAALPTGAAGYVDIQVQGRTGLTPYARWGNHPLLALIAGILLLAWFRRPKPPHR